jgi:L-threonylcarbamoyladenylate synthase
MPSHPLALALLREAAALGVIGVAAPSANRFGRVSPTTAAHVRAEFGPDLLVLDGGPCALGVESTIVDCTGDPPALLRPGGTQRARIEEVLGVALAERRADSPRASGTLEVHYAPAARLRLMSAERLAAALAARPAAPGALGVYSRTISPPAGGVLFRVQPADATLAARELFAVLREFDAAGVQQLWVEEPPAAPEWDAVRDRLRRAAAA